MGLLRTFIAADIPPSIKKSIQVQVDNLRKFIGDSSVRWVSVDNIHLTLKFLGDTSPSNLDLLKQTIRTQADSFSEIDLSIGGLGSFPSPKRARVLLIRIQAPAALEALARGVDSACAKIGYQPETRPFSPHLTIGRVRRGVSRSDQMKIQKALTEIKIDSLGTTRVDYIHLYKSELSPAGAAYTKLFSAPLNNTTRGETWTH